MLDAPRVGARSRARCEAMRDRDLINRIEIALRLLVYYGGDLTVIVLRFYLLYLLVVMRLITISY